MKNNYSEPSNTRTKRILHYVAGSMNRGGLENNLMDLYRNIDRRKYHFDFVVHAQNCFYKEEIESLGGTIYYLPFKSRDYKNALNGFRDIIRNGKYDIVHFHISYANILHEIKIAHSFGVKTIVHGHASAGGNFKKLLLNNICKQKLDKISDAKIAVSEKAARWQFSNDVIDAKRYCIINNSINADDFKFDNGIRSKIRKQLHCEKQFIIGTTGRLAKGKNIDFLIGLIRKAKKNIPNVKLIIVGDGPDKQRLERLCMDIKDDVVFTGEKENVGAYLNAFDVFCFPSLHEGLGLSAIEAQCAGLPCIINDQLPSELDVTELVYRAKLDCDLWLAMVLKLYRAKNMRRDMSAVIKSSGYNPYKNAKKIEKLYDTLVLKNELAKQKNSRSLS